MTIWKGERGFLQGVGSIGVLNPKMGSVLIGSVWGKSDEIK